MSYFDDVIEPAILKFPKGRGAVEYKDKAITSSVGLTWTTANGDKLLITDMTYRHLCNAFNAVAGRIGNEQERPDDVVVLAILQSEKNRRLGGNK